MRPVYMVIGCPGSGKSWVVNQLTGKFNLVPHDAYLGRAWTAYVHEIIKQANCSDRPVLIEAPFSVSQIKDPLEQAGLTVIPVFIQERREVLIQRYFAREGKSIPPGHLTRQETYRQRALAWGAFMGTSSQVLAHLHDVTLNSRG
jgi:hypothetical protein